MSTNALDTFSEPPPECCEDPVAVVATRGATMANFYLSKILHGSSQFSAAASDLPIGAS